MNHHYTIDTPLSYHDYNIINHFKYNTSYIQLQYTHHSPHFCRSSQASPRLRRFAQAPPLPPNPARPAPPPGAQRDPRVPGGSARSGLRRAPGNAWLSIDVCHRIHHPRMWRYMGLNSQLMLVTSPMTCHKEMGGINNQSIWVAYS